jgi:hypothetical protein
VSGLVYGRKYGESDCGVQLENVQSIIGPMIVGMVHRRTTAHGGTNSRELCRWDRLHSLNTTALV